MIRVRRYRVFFLVAVFTVLALYHVDRSRSRTEDDFFSPSPLTSWKGTLASAREKAANFVPSLRQDDVAEDAVARQALKVVTSPPSSLSLSSATIVSTTSAILNEPRPESLATPSRPAEHWRKQAERYPVSYTIALPKGLPGAIPTIQYRFAPETVVTRTKRTQKLDAVKDAFQKTWAGYKQFAWTHDELLPVTGGFKDPFCGWAATLVDSLDTLWIMGMKEEFEEAVNATKYIDFTTTTCRQIPVFETTIRYLGGLLGAYDVSGSKYQVLVDKAIELADILMTAFDTPNRMPVLQLDWQPSIVRRPHRARANAGLAELGSLSVEFTRLAQVTGEMKYYDAVARITNGLEEWQNRTQIPGLWPLYVDASGCKMPEKSSVSASQRSSNTLGLIKSTTSTSDGYGQPLQDRPNILKISPSPKASSGEELSGTLSEADGTYREKDKSSFGQDELQLDKRQADGCEPQGLTSAISIVEKFTLGGMADSTYEYLAKEYLLLSGGAPQYRSMYESMIEAAKENLLYRPMVNDSRDLRLAGTLAVRTMDQNGTTHAELVTDMGHLTCFLGGMFGLGARLFGRPNELELAKKLTDGCVWAYGLTVTGIMPEEFTPIGCDDVNECAWNETTWHKTLDPDPESRIEAQHKVENWQREAIAAVASAAAAASRVRLGLDASATVTNPVVESAHRVMEKASRATTSQIAVATPSARVPIRLENFDKRQLPELEISLQKDVKGGTASNASRTIDVSPQQPDLRKSETKDTTLMNTFVILNKSANHEEYVQQKIAGQRLSPGIVRIDSRRYILRPEAIESVFYMYRITGDESWRQKGWTMFEAIESACRTKYAYSAITDVTSNSVVHDNNMQSFWTAETLKYFYLLFSDPDIISLDEYVLNTEAHPLRRPDALR